MWLRIGRRIICKMFCWNQYHTPIHFLLQIPSSVFDIFPSCLLSFPPVSLVPMNETWCISFPLVKEKGLSSSIVPCCLSPPSEIASVIDMILISAGSQGRPLFDNCFVLFVWICSAGLGCPAICSQRAVWRYFSRKCAQLWKGEFCMAEEFYCPFDSKKLFMMILRI